MLFVFLFFVSDFSCGKGQANRDAGIINHDEKNVKFRKLISLMMHEHKL